MMPALSRCRRSRPVRARGLKLFKSLPPELIDHVAPRAGAWIETRPYISGVIYFSVAPRAGAWIETENQ